MGNKSGAVSHGYLSFFTGNRSIALVQACQLPNVRSNVPNLVTRNQVFGGYKASSNSIIILG